MSYKSRSLGTIMVIPYVLKLELSKLPSHN